MRRLIRPRRALTLTLAAVIFIARAQALASAGTLPALIPACVHHQGGGLYIAQVCAPGDRRVQWGTIGPAGPRGPQGPPGPSYSVGNDLTLAGTTFSLDPTFLSNITQGCGAGQALQKLSITSSAPTCATISGGGGTIVVDATGAVDRPLTSLSILGALP